MTEGVGWGGGGTGGNVVVVVETNYGVLRAGQITFSFTIKMVNDSNSEMILEATSSILITL